MFEELEAVRRAKEGDRAAFEQLVSAHEKKVYGLAFRSLKNEQDAMDVTQEVFLRVFRSINSFKEESSFSTWVYRITVNICVDFARKNSRKNELSLTRQSDEEEFELPLPDERYNPEDEFGKKEVREVISEAIETLSPEHRQIIVLRDIEGLSYIEIADILELSEGTVKSRLARAREKLRMLLSKGNKIDWLLSNSIERRD